MRRFRTMVIAEGVAALALLFSAGCQEARYPTPYQPFTQADGAVPGGYIDRPLGPGEYAVTFRGDEYTVWEDALSFAHRRAGELCPSGYETLGEPDVSPDQESGGRAAAIWIGYTTAVKHRLGRVAQVPRARIQVRCKTAPPGPGLVVNEGAKGIAAQ
jgi:hypothetical protein